MTLERRWHHAESFAVALDGQAARPELADVSPSKGEPYLDARFIYADERTFLAWNRTALASLPTVSRLPSFCQISKLCRAGVCSGYR